MTDREKRRVAVLYGGPSREAPVSVKSGRAVCRALRKRNYDVLELEIETAEDLGPVETVDRVFVALHGRFGEDGTVQRLLEQREIPYTGSGVRSSRLAMDKAASRKRFQEAGVPVPTGTILPVGLATEEARRRVEEEVGYPIVLKPAREGSSIGVRLCDGPEMFAEAHAASETYAETALVVERRLVGREFTVGIVGNRVLPPIELRPRREFFDYEAKYDKEAGTEYRVDPPLDADRRTRLLETARRAHEALGCSGMSRVDLFLLPDGRTPVLEVNTIPGFTETSLLPKAAAAAGLSFPELCEELLRLADVEEPVGAPTS